MKIAIYANEINLSQNTGVKVYSREIVKALSEIDNKNDYFLYSEAEPDPSGGHAGGNFDFLKEKANFKVKFSKRRHFSWTYATFPGKMKKDKPDILFMPIQSFPFFRKPKHLKIVITVHDLAFLYFPEHFTRKKRYLLNFHTRRAVKLSDRIIVPSNTTKNDVANFYNIDRDKIKVIYHGISEFGGSSGKGDENISKISQFQPYILFVGSIQPRKNIERLIGAFEMIKSGDVGEVIPGNDAIERGPLKLIICGGKGWMFEKTCERAKASSFAKDIIFTGNVSGQYLSELYKKALIFVLPSLYEGFGIPAIEAMKFGIPCVVSNNSSLSEISKKSALLIDCISISDIAEKIEELLNSRHLRAEYSQKSLARSAQFSWERSAMEHLKVFKEMFRIQVKNKVFSIKY